MVIRVFNSGCFYIISETILERSWLDKLTLLSGQNKCVPICLKLYSIYMEYIVIPLSSNYHEYIEVGNGTATKEVNLELFAQIDEKLGDLYADEGGGLYSYKKAIDCYMAAAKNNNPSAKEKTLKLMKNQKHSIS